MAIDLTGAMEIQAIVGEGGMAGVSWTRSSASREPRSREPGVDRMARRWSLSVVVLSLLLGAAPVGAQSPSPGSSPGPTASEVPSLAGADPIG